MQKRCFRDPGSLGKGREGIRISNRNLDINLLGTKFSIEPMRKEIIFVTKDDETIQ